MTCVGGRWGFTASAGGTLVGAGAAVTLAANVCPLAPTIAPVYDSAPGFVALAPLVALGVAGALGALGAVLFGVLDAAGRFSGTGMAVSVVQNIVGYFDGSAFLDDGNVYYILQVK